MGYIGELPSVLFTETNTLANGRFLLDRKLGSGGMGSVYRAFDRKKSAYVALKSLGRVDPTTIRSFKAEFRDFQHLSHPGLVALDELFSEGDDWYFTMELVVGDDIVTFVRGLTRAENPAQPVTTVAVSTKELEAIAPAVPAHKLPGAFDEAKFTRCLRQLHGALGHLHRAGKVHCDVKSQNIIVCSDGRTVLVDFGVSVDVRAVTTLAAATPLYMAPELLRSPATPAADWYAVGVLAYVAMTGFDPFVGSWQELIDAKRRLPPLPNELEPNLSPALVELSLGLLHPDPRRRLRETDVGRYLDGFEKERTARRSWIAPFDDDDVFVGRAEELALLDAVYEEARTSDGPTLVYVKGESGIGKTALVNAFVSRIADRGVAPATILRCRVFEEEVVPYKSVDGLVDALTEALRGLPDHEAAALLPETFALVADTFPALRAVEVVAGLSRVGTPDPIERRSQMFAALKECLRRLGARSPLVVTVDDLQWTDTDGLLLWNEILRGPHAPRLMLVATIRGERVGDDVSPIGAPPSTGSLSIGDRVPSLPVPSEMIWLRPFSLEESEEYVRAKALRGHGPLDLSAAGHLIEGASGHPLFLDQLLRVDSSQLDEQKTLDDIVRDRIAGLAPDARRYLEVVCIAARPLSRMLAGTSSGLGFGDGLRALKTLRRERLVKTARTPGMAGEDWIDPFHYRIRGACLGLLDGETLAARHRDIAAAMEAEAIADPEQLAFHHAHAGDGVRSAYFAKIAGDVAFEALGFGRAAELYAAALENASPAAAPAIRESLANALKNAGDGTAAAKQLLRLASGDPKRALEWRRQAAELLLRSGSIDLGTTVVSDVLRESGQSAPRTDTTAALLLVYRSVRLRVRGTGWSSRSEAEIDPKELGGLDALWSFAVGLGPVDQLRAYACAAEHTLRALDVGEPTRVARAFAMEALTAAAQGAESRSEFFSLEAERILGGLDDRGASLAFVPASRALALMMSGRWVDSLAAAVAAQGWIRGRATGAWSELSFTEEAELWSLAMTGRFDAFVERQASVALRAHEQNDLYAGFAARSGVSNLAYLVADRPERALEETRRAVALWSSRGVHLQHLFDAFAQAQAHLYSGAVGLAERALREMEARRRGRRILVPQPLVPLLRDLEGRIALARAFRGSREELRTVAAAIDALGGLGAPAWTRGLAQLLRAGHEHADGRHALAAGAAESAQHAFARVSMSYLSTLAERYAAALRRQRLPTTEREHPIARPDRLEALFVPGLGELRRDVRFPADGQARNT